MLKLKENTKNVTKPSIGMTKLSEYIELRRKSLKITQEEVSNYMGITKRTYIRKLQDGGFSEYEILKAGMKLEFTIMIFPNEADTFKI